MTTDESVATGSSLLSLDELAAVRRRLHRVQGQVGAVVTMLEQDRECRDVVRVLSAATSAMNRTGFVILNHALRQCLVDPASTAEDLDELERLFLDLS